MESSCKKYEDAPETNPGQCQAYIWRILHCSNPDWIVLEHSTISASTKWWWRHWSSDTWALLDWETSWISTILILSRWHLCQALVQHFWLRWSAKYLSSLRFMKWHHPNRNMQVGDVVLLQEDTLVPTEWSLAKVIATHPGKDGVKILDIPW